MGTSHSDRPMVVLNVFRDSECDAGGGAVQKRQFQRDLIIKHPLSGKRESSI